MNTEDNEHALLEFEPSSQRRILLVSPRFAYSFGTFNHAFPLMGVKGFMPPQGLLLIASLLPKAWEVRFIDENVEDATSEDFAWADAVLTSGMHIQRDNLNDIARRAHDVGKPVAIGGPSVSAAPEYYPEIDWLHIGEVGEGTLELFRHIDQSRERPGSQLRFETSQERRLPLDRFPTPAYDRILILDYLLGSVQFSSGCPFTCEFCDIPNLYGRNPRMKTPEQILAELDALAEGGAVSIYFVDDNFIANPNAAEELLPHLIEWQKKWDFQVRLSCEATLNIAKYKDILEAMRQAFFTNIFVGIETPEPDALVAMKKSQNLGSPILEALHEINRHGMEVAGGIIMGLDTDTPETPEVIKEFSEASNIPIMTVNILYALPHTPLYDRLERDGRLLSEKEHAGRDSNIRFLEPYENVAARWRDVIDHIFEPSRLYKRYAYNANNTYPHRLGPTKPIRQATWTNIKRAAGIFSRVIWNIGLRGHYKRIFWKMAVRELCRGKIETFFQVSMVAHHLIVYGRECVEGKLQASNYSSRSVEREPASAAR